MSVRSQKQGRWLLLGLALLIIGLFVGIQKTFEPALEQGASGAGKVTLKEVTRTGSEKEGSIAAKSDRELISGRLSVADLLPSAEGEVGLMVINADDLADLLGEKFEEDFSNHVLAPEEAAPFLERALERGSVNQNLIFSAVDNEKWAADLAKSKFVVSGAFSQLPDSTVRCKVTVFYGDEQSQGEGNANGKTISTIARVPQGALLLVKVPEWDEVIIVANPLALPQQPIPIEVLRTFSPEVQERLMKQR